MLLYTTLHKTTLHKTTLHYTTLHYITLDPLHPYNMTATSLHKLHYTTTTTPLRYNYYYSCSTPHYIQQLWARWPLQPLQPLQQTQLQPPLGQSVNSLCHPWFTTTNLSYRFPILKLPPPPCVVLLVFHLVFILPQFLLEITPVLTIVWTMISHLTMMNVY